MLQMLLHSFFVVVKLSIFQRGRFNTPICWVHACLIILFVKIVDAFRWKKNIYLFSSKLVIFCLDLASNFGCYWVYIPKFVKFIEMVYLWSNFWRLNMKIRRSLNKRQVFSFLSSWFLLWYFALIWDCEKKTDWVGFSPNQGVNVLTFKQRR